MNRRHFLRTMAAGSAAAAASVRGADANRRLRLGLIGCGWFGLVDLKAALRAGNAEAAALCDVDSEHLSDAADEIEKLQGARPRAFKDYRELLALPGLDAVFIAAPTHWHALMFIDACKAGLAVYCQKPLSYDVREGQAMLAAARQHGTVVQVAFQRRQSDGLRAAAEYIRAGRIGRVVQVEAQIHYSAPMKDTTVQEPPASLDWDLWCGPAPKLPYRPNIGHFNWRFERAYGNGHLVDWGIHLIDAFRFILHEGAPRSVAATGGIYELRDRINTPDTLTAQFDFERCLLLWRHRIWGAAEYSPETSQALLFYGDKATLLAGDQSLALIARDAPQSQRTAAIPQTVDMQAKHVADFLAAVRSRDARGLCGVGEAFESTTAVQLAMIAWQSAAAIRWDGAKREIIGNATAAALLKRDYREPWRHPHAG